MNLQLSMEIGRICSLTLSVPMSSVLTIMHVHVYTCYVHQYTYYIVEEAKHSAMKHAGFVPGKSNPFN